MTTKAFGLIIIGDEILSGKRPDAHFAKVRSLLAARGLSLSWVQYLGDDRQRCKDFLRTSFASTNVVFSCGGIGATPDDHTRQAAADALQQPLTLHPHARALISQRCREMAASGQGDADMNTAENRQRLKMGEFPAEANIIENPYNQIPGFNIRDHWFVPGFPVMAWPMIEAVLDQHYAAYFNREARSEKSFLVFDMAESKLTPLMEEIERRFVGIKVFSLPSVGDAGRSRHIELGVKGPTTLIESAYQHLHNGTQALGGQIEAASSPA